MLNEPFYDMRRYMYVDGRFLVAEEGKYFSVYGLPSQLQNSNYYKPVTAENSEYIETAIYSYLPEGTVIGAYDTKRYGFQIVYSLEYMGKNYEFNYVKWNSMQ